MSVLTISIPTYNRGEKLAANLRKLLPQVTDEKIVVVDNHSDIPAENYLREIIIDFPSADIRIIRNKVNIGIAANFLRCFESCETNWLWILSDDDPPFQDAVSIVRRDIQTFADYTFFNYASSMVEFRKASLHSVGVNDFIKKMDSFVNTIFISSGIFNMSVIMPNLRIGYIYAYSLAPHLAALMYSLGEKNKVMFSTDKLVQFDIPADKDTWSWLNYFQVRGLLLEVPLPLTDETFRLLFDKLNAWHVSDEEIFHQLIEANKTSRLKSKYIFIQIITRSIFRRRSVRQKLTLCHLLLKLLLPGIFGFGKKRQSENQKDLLARI